MSGSHKRENLAAENEITDKFNVTDKISAVVTNSASGITRATKIVLKLKHFTFGAHTLNLIT